VTTAAEARPICRRPERERQESLSNVMVEMAYYTRRRWRIEREPMDEREREMVIAGRLPGECSGEMHLSTDWRANGQI